MTPALGPVFDESLASVARELYVAQIAALAVGSAVLLFRWLERRGRAKWSAVPAGTLATSRAPYRSSEVVSGFLPRAPGLVRAASLGSLVFGHLFAPLIVLALVKYPFDGIAVPLIPGMALALLNWSCAWMLLRRSPLASSAVRSGAVGSLMANAGLIVIAGVHFAFVELQRRDGIEHACSSSVTFVVIVFAVCSVIQALLMMAALRRHDAALVWTAPAPRHEPNPHEDVYADADADAGAGAGDEADVEAAVGVDEVDPDDDDEPPAAFILQ
jgi:hypothetical protein